MVLAFDSTGDFAKAVYGDSSAQHVGTNGAIATTSPAGMAGGKKQSEKQQKQSKKGGKKQSEKQQKQSKKGGKRQSEKQQKQSKKGGKRHNKSQKQQKQNGGK